MKFLSPDGDLHIVPVGQLNKFCKTIGIGNKNLRGVWSKKCRHTFGWMRFDEPDPFLILTNGEKEETICKYYLSGFLRKYNLEENSYYKMIRGEKDDCSGWRIKK